MVDRSRKSFASNPLVAMVRLWWLFPFGGTIMFGWSGVHAQDDSTTSNATTGTSTTSSPPMSTCDETMNRFCEVEANRYCYVVSNNNNETTGDGDGGGDGDDFVCGNCLVGFVEWRARCLSERQVDIVLFLEEYAPQFLEPLSNEARANLLRETIEFIAGYQNQNPPPPFELGLNMFSADTQEEIRSRLGFIPMTEDELAAEEGTLPTFQSVPTFQSTEELPDRVDWVEAGVVTSVKDQGRCGCCWAVSAAGAIEGATAIQNDFLQSLSFQQYISCDDRNSGCNGGSLVYAMAYPIQDTDGLSTNTDYPFTDAEGTTTTQCNTAASIAVAVTEASYVVDFYDDYTVEERLQRMKAAVAKQPVAMVLRSGCQLFNSYQRGILTTDQGCECDDPMCADHAVLMVGYDDTTDPPCWKIKNSWSEGWGESGYVRIAQTTKGDFGLFGILVHGVVPDLTFNLTDGSIRESEAGSTPGETKFPWWAWLLILLGVLAVAFVAVSCFTGLFCPRKKE